MALDKDGNNRHAEVAPSHNSNPAPSNNAPASNSSKPASTKSSGSSSTPLYEKSGAFRHGTSKSTGSSSTPLYAKSGAFKHGTSKNTSAPSGRTAEQNEARVSSLKSSAEVYKKTRNSVSKTFGNYYDRYDDDGNVKSGDHGVSYGHYEEAIRQIANGNESVRKQYAGTWIEQAGNDLKKAWVNGEDANIVIKNGELVFQYGDEREDAHFWTGQGGTRNQKYDNENLRLLNLYTGRAVDYINSGVYNKETTDLQIRNVETFMDGIKNGVYDDKEIMLDNGESILMSEWLGNIVDHLNGVNEGQDIQHAIDVIDHAGYRASYLWDSMAEGKELDMNEIYGDLRNIQLYAERFKDNEYLGGLFGEVLDSWSDLYNRAQSQRYGLKISELEEQIRKATHDAAEATVGTPYWKAGNIGEYNKEAEDLKAQKVGLERKKKELDDTYRDNNAPQEILDAIARVNIDNQKDRAKVYEAYWKSLSQEERDAFIIAHGGELISGNSDDLYQVLADEDNAAIKAFYQDVGLDPELFTTIDKTRAGSTSVAKGTVGNIVNAGSLLLRLTGESLQNSTANGAPELGDNAILPTRIKDQAGYKAAQDELAELEHQRHVLASSVPYSGDPAQQAELELVEKKIANLEAKIQGMEENREVYDPTTEFADTLVGKGEDLNKWAARYRQEADELMAQVKNGTSELGSLGIDVAVALADIGFDTFSGLGPWGIVLRNTGAAAFQYQDMGADTYHQAIGAFVSTILELATEKVGGTFGYAYGAGFADDFVDDLIGFVAKSDVGANFLRLFAGFVSEGGEEVISELGAPLIDWLADPDNRATWEYNPEGVLRAFFVGGAAGLAGETVNFATGKYKSDNAEMRKNDAEIIAKSQSGAKLTSFEKKQLQGALGRLPTTAAGDIPIGEVTSRAKGNHRMEKSVNKLAPGFEKAFGQSTGPTQEQSYGTANSEAAKTDPDEESKRKAEEEEAARILAEEQAEQERQKAEEERKKAEEENKALDEASYLSQEPPPRGPNDLTTTEQVERELTEREEEARKNAIDAENAGKTPKEYYSEPDKYGEGKELVKDTLRGLQQSAGTEDGSIVVRTRTKTRDSEFSSGSAQRTIASDTIDMMINATGDDPIVYHRKATNGNPERGTSAVPEKVFRYDGVVLEMATINDDGTVSIQYLGPEDVGIQARYLQGVLDYSQPRPGYGSPLWDNSEERLDRGRWILEQGEEAAARKKAEKEAAGKQESEEETPAPDDEDAPPEKEPPPEDEAPLPLEGEIEQYEMEAEEAQTAAEEADRKAAAARAASDFQGEQDALLEAAHAKQAALEAKRKADEARQRAAEAYQQEETAKLEAAKKREAEEAEQKRAAEAEQRKAQYEEAQKAAQQYQDEQTQWLNAQKEAQARAAQEQANGNMDAAQAALEEANQAKAKAEEAAAKAKEAQDMAESQRQALEALEAPVKPAPANTKKSTAENVATAESQSQTLEGQEKGTAPVQSNESAEISTETGQGDVSTSEDTDTAGETEEPVKPAETSQQKTLTPQERKSDAVEVTRKVNDAVNNGKLSGQPVANVGSNTFQKTPGGKLTEKVGAFFQSLGNKVTSRALGGKEVIIDGRSIRSDIAHGVGKAKAATFAAVPSVLEKGVVIDQQKNWKNRGYDTTLIAAPVTIDGKPAYVGCVVTGVQEGGTTRFYLHEVVDGKGNLIYSFSGMPTAEAIKKGSGVDIQTGIAKGDTGSTPEPVTSIAQKGEEGNGKKKRGKATETGLESDNGGRELRRGEGADDTGSGGGTSRLASRAPRFTGVGAKQTRESWLNYATTVEKQGGRILAQREYSKATKKYTSSFKKLFGVPVTVYDASGMKNAPVGFTVKNVPGVGVFIGVNHAQMRRGDGGVVNGPGTGLLHEHSHQKWSNYNGNATPKSMVMAAFARGKVSKTEAATALHEVLKAYGYNYIKQNKAADFLGVSSAEAWKKLSDQERAAKLKQLPESNQNKITNTLYEELGNYLLTNDARLSKYRSFKRAISEAQEEAINIGLYTRLELDNALQYAREFDESSMREKEEAAIQEEIKKAVDNAKPISEFDPNQGFAVYSLPDSEGRERKLVAIRNTSLSSAIRAIKDGGIAMGSIAIINKSRGHSSFGEIGICFRSDTINPDVNSENNVYSVDSYTPTFPSVETQFVGDSNGADKYANSLMESILPFYQYGFAGIDAVVGKDPSGTGATKLAIASEAGYTLDSLIKEAQRIESKAIQNLKEKIGKALGAKEAPNIEVEHNPWTDNFIIADTDTGELYLEFEYDHDDLTFNVDYGQKAFYKLFDLFVQEVPEGEAKVAGPEYVATSNLYNELINVNYFNKKPNLSNLEAYSNAANKIKQYSDIKGATKERRIGEGTGFTIQTPNGEIIIKRNEDDIGFEVVDYFSFEPEEDPAAQKYIDDIVDRISAGENLSRDDAILEFYSWLEGVDIGPETRYAIQDIAKKIVPDNVVSSWIDNLVGKFGEYKTGFLTKDGTLLDYSLENALKVMQEDPRRRSPTDGGVDDEGIGLTVEDIYTLVGHWFGTFDELKAHEHILSETRAHDFKQRTLAATAFEDLKSELENGFAASPYNIRRDYDFMPYPNADKFLGETADWLETIKGVRQVTDTQLLSDIATELTFRGWDSDSISPEEMAKNIIKVFNQIADLPTGYFEAKPNRVISKKEYAVFLIPTSQETAHYRTSRKKEYNAQLQELKALCDAEGIPYIEYDNDRTRADIIANDLDDYDGVVFEQPDAEESNQPLTEREQALQDELDKVRAENESVRAENEALKAKYVPEENTRRTSGTKSTQRSASEQRSATPGERRQTKINTADEKNNGEFISRTNADRSHRANQLLDTPEKMAAEYERLVNSEAWTDDDVVMAEKIRFEKIMAIRDYQLHRGKKMSREAFKTLSEEYNELTQKYKDQMTKAGQKLQANYTFTPGEQIRMKAAQTFLGFTKDGRFAGASPNAKNAKVYAGIEEAARRIDRAVQAGDAQAIANICKDISNIRNVKLMFGKRLGNFVGKLETKVLNRIAERENGTQILEMLAYGNLNAVCDDVQPYKHLNAVKTIRVMNMLSNASTIVNNIGNNIARGMVSNNPLGQWVSQKAAAPFEKLTGTKIISQSQTGWLLNKEIRNAEFEMLEQASLMQLYGIQEKNGRLELNDQGMFNPNINPFEQTMALYKFLTGMGVEATDQIKAAGLLKSMEIGIDKDIASKKIKPEDKERLMQEARHEVNKLLYKDDNAVTAEVQRFRNFLNKAHLGNERTGTIGLGDITMAFAKIPTNVIKARLAMTPEGALLNTVQYCMGVNKAKRMHSEVMARGIYENGQFNEQLDHWQNELEDAYAMPKSEEKDAAIAKAKSELQRIDSEMWAQAREQCSGSVYNNLIKIRNNYNEGMSFVEAVERAGYHRAKEMTKFEMAQLSRKLGSAAMSAGMMAVGAALRACGALRDFDEEPNDEIRKMNAEQGYSGLMLNLSQIITPGREWDPERDLIVSGEWLEVVALPLTIGATAAEAYASASDMKEWAWFKSMAGNGLGKTFESIGDLPGMADAINFYNSMMDSFGKGNNFDGSKIGQSALYYAANTIPSFFMPNAVTQLTAGFDNTVRNVYAADTPWGVAGNMIANKLPKLRQKVPASIDMWGEERHYGENKVMGILNKWLLPGDIVVYRKSKYEQEVERLAKEGYTSAIPKATVSSSFEVGDEKYTMTPTEINQFRAIRNKAEAEAYKALMDSKYYDTLSDPEKESVIASLKTSAERDARQEILRSRQLDVDVSRYSWESKLSTLEERIQYLVEQQKAGEFWDKDENQVSDYTGMDNFIANNWSKLNKDQQQVMLGSYPYLDNIAGAAKAGINSEKWQIVQNIAKKYYEKDENGHYIYKANLANESKMWAEMAAATGFSDDGPEMKHIQENFELTYTASPKTDTYDELIEAGLSRESVAKYYGNKEQLPVMSGYSNVQDRQVWDKMPSWGFPDNEQWEIFFDTVPTSNTKQIRDMKALQVKINPKTQLPYTFREATVELGLNVYYTKHVDSKGKEIKTPAN